MDTNFDSLELFDLSQLNYKKRQHYVSKFYLRLWLAGERIFVKRSVGKVFSVYPKTTVDDVAVENYFYEIEMDDVVWDMLDYTYSEKAKKSPLIKKILRELLFLKLADDTLNKGIGIVNDHKVLRDNAKEILKHMKKHHLEDAYEKIETAVSAEINAFSKSQGSTVFVLPTAETFNNILVFYSFQLFRTKGRITLVEQKISQLLLERGDEKFILTPVQKQSVLKCMLYIQSYEFCLQLEKAGCSMIISKNHTNLNYLTSDCPAMYFDETVNQPGLKAYGAMPLTPRLMVQISVPDISKKTGTIGLQDVYDIKIVQMTNKIIEKESHELLFAKTMKDFELSEIAVDTLKI